MQKVRHSPGDCKQNRHQRETATGTEIRRRFPEHREREKRCLKSVSNAIQMLPEAKVGKMPKQGRWRRLCLNIW